MQRNDYFKHPKLHVTFRKIKHTHEKSSFTFYTSFNHFMQQA